VAATCQLRPFHNFTSNSAKANPEFHLDSGGLVSYDRKIISPHLVQSCIKRGWVLASADYRFLPQVDAGGLMDDVKAAYDFVCHRLMTILGRQGNPRVVVAGASSGRHIRASEMGSRIR
jgi:acetyl esterase/lipase